jgi:hypothetical protein
MSTINDFMTATCEYTHKDSKGRVIGIGKTKIDWKGDIHARQVNVKTGEVTESIWHADGTLHKTIVKSSILVKFLRLVGLKERPVKL